MPALLVLLIVALSACGGTVPKSRALSPEPLDRAAIDVLARAACPRVLAQTFPLEGTSGNLTTGKLWVRRCSAREVGPALGIDMDLLGWQWVGAGSWGFDVHEYVYFHASVQATLRTAVEADGVRPKLRVWSESAPEVQVRELGRVSARAEGPAASLLGVTFGAFGQGPNVLATSALRSRVRDLIRTRARSGLEIALGETPPPGAPELAHVELLQETESLFPGGALISGSFPPNISTTLRFEVTGDATALARAVCVEVALPLVDAVVAGLPTFAPEAPADAFVLHGRGEIVIDPRPCSWVLVTGASDDAPVVVKLELVRGRPPRVASRTRWARTTLRAYEVEAPETPLLGFTVSSGDASSSFGGPLTNDRSPSVGLVAEPLEVRDGVPVIVEIRALKPRARSFWTAQTTYDQLPLARASIPVEPGQEHQEHRATLERFGRPVGWVKVAFDVLEVE